MAFLIAGDSAPLRRTSEPPLECRRFAQGTKAVPDRVLRQIDIHVAFEVALFEPIQNVHCRFIERQRDLVRISRRNLSEVASPRSTRPINQDCANEVAALQAIL